MPTRWRSARFAAAMGTLLLAAGCGSSKPEPLTPMKPDVPADFCATVPPEARKGLIFDANTDMTGNPTAACSLRSPAGSKDEVRAVVTWVQLNDDGVAADVLASQCRSIDHSEYQDQSGFAPQGADDACAASGKVDGADSATMAAVAGREVITVRLSEDPPGDTPASQRAQDMLEGVLAALAD